MSMERAQFLGQREEFKARALRLEASIQALRQAVRTALNPFVPSEEIDAVAMHEQAYELAEKIQKYKEIKLKIKTISRELGDRNA